MGTKYAYFYAQLKRVFRILPILIVMTIILFCSMMILLLSVMKNGTFESERKKYQIGIVGDISDTYLGFGINALQSLDDSRFLIDFHSMTEKEARESLHSGQLTAYVRVPDGLVESLVTGANNKPITYIAAEGQKGITSILMEELSAIVSTIVTRSQSAVYGMQNILSVYGINNIWLEATNRLNLRYIELVINRTKLCDLIILGVSNGLSTEGYYFCSLLLFFLLISSITSSYLFVHRGSELSRSLAARGIRAFKQVMGEYLAYVFLMIVYLVVIFIIIGIAFKGNFPQISEWKDMNDFTMISFFISLFPVVIMLAAFHFFLFEMVSGLVNNILFHFISSISMAYLSGYFYPEQFFPEILKRIGNILPTGVALHYTSDYMTGNFVISELFGLLIYTLFFLVLSVFFRKHRIKRG